MTSLQFGLSKIVCKAKQQSAQNNPFKEYRTATTYMLELGSVRALLIDQRRVVLDDAIVDQIVQLFQVSTDLPDAIMRNGGNLPPTSTFHTQYGPSTGGTMATCQSSS